MFNPNTQAQKLGNRSFYANRLELLPPPKQ